VSAWRSFCYASLRSSPWSIPPIVSIALPSIRRELGFTGADAGWILNGYALTFGGLVLLLGRAGDLYGRRRLFVVGLALFAAASFVGGFAWEPWILVCARFIQGVGAAALVPASLSLLTTIFAEGKSATAPSASTVRWRPWGSWSACWGEG
jgi:MFS family permease